MGLPFPSSVPVEGASLISRQGPRASRRTWHNGVDLSVVSPRGRGTKGSPVLAVAYGTVELVDLRGYQGTYGNVVVVRHAPALRSVYAHLDEVLVEEGDTISSGEQLGTVGDTTSLRTGMSPHLHLELVSDWPLAPDDFESRYDVLGELALVGVVLEGTLLVAGDPATYHQPGLEAGKPQGDWVVVVAPEEDPSPGTAAAMDWVVPTVAVAAAVAIFLATAFLLRRPRDMGRTDAFAPPKPCSPWRSVFDGEPEEVRTVCKHRARTFRQARVWSEGDGTIAVVEDGYGRTLQRMYSKDRREALRWANYRLPAGGE